MKLYIKSFNGEVITIIKCKQSDSVCNVIQKCRKEHPTIFKLVSLLPTYRELNQLNSLYEEFIYKKQELYVIFNETLACTIKQVKQNGLTLQFASKELQSDIEVVLEAVKQNGNSLCYASNELRGNRYVVLKAVKQNGLALEFSSYRLKNDKKVVLEAMIENRYAIKYSNLQYNAYFLFNAFLMDLCDIY